MNSTASGAHRSSLHADCERCFGLCCAVPAFSASVLVPTGSVPQPLAWWRAVRGRLARSRRYLQITGIAIRHGLAPYLLGTPAGPAITDQIGLYQLLGYNLLVIGGVLALRVLVLIFRADQ